MIPFFLSLCCVMIDSEFSEAEQQCLTLLIDSGYAVSTKSSEAPRAGMIKVGGWDDTLYGEEELAALSLLAPRIFRLELCNMRLNDRLEWLANAKGLRYLNLSGSGVSDAALPYIPKVECYDVLALAKNPITDEGLRHLADLRIEGLVLNNTQISTAGLYLLRHVDALKFLDVEHTGIDDGIWQFLAQRRKGQKIDWLNLGRNELRGTGMEALQGMSIDTISLQNTAVDNEACKAIATYDELSTVELGHTLIDDDGLKELAQIETLAFIRANATRVSDVGLMYLKDLPELHTLDLYDTQVTAEGVKKFWQARKKAPKKKLDRIERLLLPRGGKLKLTWGKEPE